MGTSEVNFRTQIAEELSRSELIDRLCEYHEKIQSQIEEPTAAEVLSGFLWERTNKLTLILNDKNKIEVDQDSILKLLMDFQNWQLERANADIFSHEA